MPEDAANMFESMGFDTGIEQMNLSGAADFLEKTLNRRFPGRMNRVLRFQQSCDVQRNNVHYL
jgi:hypothetical protein